MPPVAERTEPVTRRRTQRERRETTIGNLVDATIASIGEVGYSATSIQRICRGAGVSQGALFRHFPTKVDLVCAAAAEVGMRLTAELRRRVAGTEDQPDPLVAVLRVVRDLTRTEINVVWNELLLAARTDETLRVALTQAIDDYARAILAEADTLTVPFHIPPDLVPAVVFSVIDQFKGSSITAFYARSPEFEEQQLQLVAAMVRSAAATRVDGPP